MILGFHGKMGAGKNAAAKRLALLSPLPVVEVSFAAKLKESAAALLGCSVDDLERWKNDPRIRVDVRVEEDHGWFVSQTVRSFLQRYGTEAHRDVFGEDFWLDAALPFESSEPPYLSRDALYRDAIYVATDVRFPNEAMRVRDLGGTVVRLVGPDEETGSHMSEQVLETDFVIDNRTRDDGFERLDRQLAALLDDLFAPPTTGG